MRDLRVRLLEVVCVSLRESVERQMLAAVNRTCDDLTAELHSQARAAGVPDDEVDSLRVVFRDGGFFGTTEHSGFLEREYGSPPLGLLRRFNRQAPALASPLLDQHMASAV